MKKIIVTIYLLFFAFSQNYRGETTTLIGEFNYEFNDIETNEEAMMNCQRRAIINSLENYYLSLETQHILKPSEIDCLIPNLLNIDIIEKISSNTSLFLRIQATFDSQSLSECLI